MNKNKMLMLHLMYGLVSYVGIVYVLMKYSSSFESGYFSGRNLFVILLLLSAMSAYFVSSKLNTDLVLPLYHPVVLFLKIIFSKLSLFPALFFPLGALVGVFVLSVLQNKLAYIGTYRLAIGIFVILYVSGMVGAFINILKLNKR